MARLLPNGTVFLHVPKTGGSWITNVFHNLGLDPNKTLPPSHGHLKMLQLKERPSLVFCFVRDPVTWHESWWKYQAGRSPGTRSGLRDWERYAGMNDQASIDLCVEDDFNQYIRNVLDRNPGYVSRMYERFTDGADFVGRYENLKEDLITALRMSGVDVDPKIVDDTPPWNISKAKLGLPVWDPELLAKIIEVERGAIERFGYAKNNL